MAKHVLKDASVKINGVDLSDHVMEVTLNTPTELQDASTMGTSARRRVSGLIDWSLDITFTQDYDSGSVDFVLSAIQFGQSAGTMLAVPIEVLPNKTAGVGHNNPKYTGNVFLGQYTPLAGQVGNLNTCKVTFSSDSALTRATA